MKGDKRLLKILEKGIYYNKLFNAVKSYYNREKNRVRDTCYIEDMDLRKIQVFDKFNYDFIGVVSCYPIVRYVENYKEDGETEFLYIIFEASLNDMEKTFKIIDVTETRPDYKFCMSNDFIPHYKKEEYDSVANSFINTYCEDAIKGKININKLLTNMHNKIEYHKITEDSSVFGIFVFEETFLEIYDSGKLEKVKILSNTIVLDKEAVTWQDEDNINNFTIIHECVHSYIHRKYFYFNKMMQSSDRYLKCLTIEDYANEDIRSLENQANKIGARILMPKSKIQESINNFKSHYSLETAKSYEFLLDYLKEEFNVSYSALKVRLNELEYTNFVGIKEYVDDKYLVSYLSNTKINYNESYSISVIDYIRLMISTPKFKEIVENNNYIYIDGHVCKNSDKYLKRIDNKIKINDYGLNHIDECCLKFEYKYTSINGNIINNIAVLCRNSNRFISLVLFKDEKEKDYTNTDGKELELYSKYAAKIVKYKKELPEELGESLKIIINDLGLTQETVAYDAGISTQTLKRILNNEEYSAKRRTLTCIFYTMGLPYDIVEELFRKGGKALSGNYLEIEAIKILFNSVPYLELEKMNELYDKIVESK